MKCLQLCLFGILLFLGTTNPVLAQIPSSGLRLHLKADAGTSTTVSGQKVSSWTDQSGNGYQAVETNTTWQPTYIVENGISMLRFNSAAPTSMNLPTHSQLGIQNSEYEFFLVTKTSSQSGAQFALAGGVNYNEIQISGANGVRFITQLGNSLDNSARVDNGEFHVINSIAKTTGSELGVDGVYVSKNGDATHSVDVAFHLGTRANGDFRLDGDIAEIIMYNRKLSGVESMQVTEYLKDKYSTPFTAYAAPGTPASNLGFSSVTQNSMNLNLSKGSGANRVIIARKGSAVNVAPVDGVSYTGNLAYGLGNQVGSGNYVMYAGTAGTSNSITNLLFDETYHFAVYEYYLINGVPQYSEVTTASQTTPNLTQTSNLQISGRTANSFSGSLTQGSGGGRLIVARQGGAVNQSPTDGVGYIADANFGSGSQIGSGNYVIHDGIGGSSFSMTNLDASTTYHLAVYEYSNFNGDPKYLISGAPTASNITFPSTPSSNVQFSSTGLNEMTVSATPGNGNKRIIVAREGAAVSIAPTNGQSYSASSTFGSGTDLGSGNYVVYDGAGSSVALSSLSNSTTYHFAVYEYSEYAGVKSYLNTSPALGSNSTTVVPLPVISGATFGSGTATSREIQAVVNPGGFETTVEVIYGTDAGVLSSTTASQNIGSGSTSDSLTVNVIGLATGQTYYAKLRATNIRGAVESSVVTLVPLTLTSLQGWYRADIVVSNGNILTEWLDFSNSGHDIVKRGNSVGLTQTGINGKPSAVFNKSVHRFTPSELDIYNTDLEMFIVFKSSSTNNQSILEQDNNQLVALNNSSNGVMVNPGDIYNGEVTSGAVNAYTDGNGHVLHYKTANNRHQVRIDNEVMNYKIGNNRFLSAGEDIYLGGVWGDESFIGQIAEIFFYNAELSFEQRQEIAQYLSDRYAISMFVPSVPETPASSLNFTNVGPTSFDVSLTKGDGERRIIVARLNGSAKTAPATNSVYTANTNFGSGSNLGNNNYVVYDGTGNSVAVSGLSANSEYTIDVYEYDNMELDPQYMLSSPNSASKATQSVSLPTVQLSSVLYPSTTTATVQSLINPNGYQTSIQVFYGTDPETLNSSTSSQVVGSQSTAQAMSISLTGLNEGIQYYYKISATNVGGITDSEVGSFIYKEEISLPSLQLWLSGDGATFTSNSGDPVSNWVNQAGKPTKAYQTAVSNAPLRITNSNISFLRFDGSSDFLELPSTDTLGITDNDYEVFIVARSNSQEIGFLMGGTVGNFELHTRPGGGVGTRFIPKSGVILDNSVNTTDGEFHIFNAKATSEKAVLRIDGSGSFVNQGVRSGVASNLIMGARRSGGYYFNGDIAEVIVYSSDLSELETAKIEHYLANRYGVELPEYLVTSTSDANTGEGKTGTLRYILNQINSEASDSVAQIDMSKIDGTITLTSDLPPLNYDVVINGPGEENLTVSGNDLYRPFFLGAGTSPFSPEDPAAPDVTMKNFSIKNGMGAGGKGFWGGGGGAGMGGAIFVNDGKLTMVNMDLSNNVATGGNSGTNASGSLGIGGGFDADAVHYTPGSGGYLGGAVPGSAGEIAGPGAGGYSGSPSGGAGGFGAGGGPGSNNGTFTDNFGGNGGFGGGGGGVSNPYSVWDTAHGGTSEFGGGSGILANSTAYGGGGAGMGGAVFNRSGNVFIKDSKFFSNTANGGTGGISGSPSNGSGYGGALFNYQGIILESNVTYGTNGDVNSAENQADFYNYSVPSTGSYVVSLSGESDITSSSFTVNAEITTFGVPGSYNITHGKDSTNLSGATSTVNFTGENSEETIAVSITGIDLSTVHYYKVVVNNELGTFESSIGSILGAPTIASSLPVISQVSTTGINGSITKGNGANRLILAKKGSAVDVQPANDQVYTANSAFGSGTELGTENFVVYYGSDSTFSVSGLEAGNEYHFSVFEYNGTIETKYLISSALTFSESTLSNLPAGLPGSNITFEGSNEDIVVPHGSEFNSTAVTMELWFKSDDSGTDYDFLTSKASEELEIHLGADGVANTIRFIPATQVYIDSPAGVFSAGEWTHLAVVYDPSKALAKMYVNGERVVITNNGSNPLTTPRKQTTNSFYLGSRAGSSLYFNGSMDEIRLWNVVRTGDEIREFMHRPIQSDFQDMIAYWQFNEGSGTSLADNISGLDGTLEDFEFNANNGWSDSEIAFSTGSFTSVDEVTSGTQSLSSLSFNLTEDFDNPVTLTSDYLNTAPNVIPEIEETLKDSYWIVKTIGDPGNFVATLTFTVPSSMTSKGTAANSQFKLYRRPSNGTGSWTVVKQEASSFTSNTVSFTGVSELGQFTIGREIEIEYAQGPGSAVKFDGSNDYISIPDNDAFNVDEYTLELWFKWNEGASNVEFLMGKALTEFEIHTIGSNNSIRFIPAPSVFIDSPADAFVSDTWTHLAVVYDPSESLAKMYFNGEEVTPTVSGSLSTSLTGSSGALNFGRRSNNTLFFNGQMDEVRLWSTVRSEAQIQQDMNATTPSGYEEGLVGYWQLNEGTGTVTSEATSNLSGTLNGFDFNATSGWLSSRAPIEDRVPAQTTFTGTEGWRLIASPVTDTTISSLLADIWTQGFTGANVSHGSPNVYTWSVEDGTSEDSNWVALTDLSNSPSNGSAALVYVFGDDNGPGVEGNAGFPKTVGVEGLEPTSDRDLTSLLNTNARGWSLLGNPYKKDVDWDNFTKTNLSEAVYVYDANAASWKEWSGGVGDLSNGEIGAFNGFFVQTTGENPTLTIPRSAKLDSTTKFLGKQSESQEVFFLSLSLKNEHGLSDQSWFRLSEEGEEGLDNKDAHSLTPLGSSFVTIGSLLEDETLLSINNLPLDKGIYELPLDLSSTESGEHTISIDQFALPDGWKIQLKDTQTGTLSGLEEPYSFYMEGETPKEKVSGSSAPVIQKFRKVNSNPRFILTVTSGNLVPPESELGLPETFAMQQNYPNPFNPSTTIKYQLPEKSQVLLKVFDVLGREVVTLIDEKIEAGYHQVRFDGRSLASGLYLYRLKAGNTVITKKLTLIK